MKIKYVGVKHDGETAFISLTGITWYQGDSHEVKDEHAVNMLNHPDVFDRDEQAVKKPVITLTQAPTAALAPGSTIGEEPVTITLPDGTTKDIGALDKAALLALAKELDVAVHHSSGPAKIMAALVEAFPAKA